MDYDGLYEDSMKLYIAEVYSGANMISYGSDLMSQHTEMLAHTKHENYVSTVTSQSFRIDNELESDLKESTKFNTENFIFNLTDVKSDSKTTIVAVIKQKFPIKEIWIKKRKTWVTTAMLELGDGYGNTINLVMWGKQCKCMLSVSPGCVLQISQVMASEFQGRRSIKMSKDSVLTNLGVLHKLTIYEKVAEFQHEFARMAAVYPNYAQTITTIHKPLQGDIKFCTRPKPGTLAHIRVKISALHSKTSDLYNSKPQRITITILGNSQPCHMFLHGSSKSWMKKITLLKKQVWEFFFVACTNSTESDTIELQTTVISGARSLFHDDDKVKESMAQYETVRCIENLLAYFDSKTKYTINVEDICTKSILCTIGTKRLLVNKETPEHLIHMTVGRCCLENKLPMIAHCYFNNDSNFTLFNIRICNSTLKSDSLRSIITNLLTKISRLRMTHYQSDIHDMFLLEELY